MPMAAPLKGVGTSATAMRSRMAENKTSTREKPKAAPKPYKVDSKKPRSRLVFCNATPSTAQLVVIDRKSTRLNSSHVAISYAVFCLKKKKKHTRMHTSSE